MFRPFVLAFLSLLVFSKAGVTDCNASSIFRPTKLGLEPPVPIIGETVKMLVEFENPGPQVTAGTVTTTVTLNFIPFSPTVEALCQNTACPIVVGHNDRSTSSVWPNVIGNIVTTSVWNSAEGDNLLCVKTSVKVGSKSSSSSPHLRTSNTQPTQKIEPFFRDDLSKKAMIARDDRFGYLICSNKTVN